MSLIELDDALAMLATAVVPLPPEEVASESAVGGTLAADAVARSSLPPFDVSAMDGYAVPETACEQACTLSVAFEVAAGDEPGALPADRAARIFTGAMLPSGTAAVVPQEDARTNANAAVHLPRAEPGAHIRRAGEVLRAGDAVVQAGAELTSARLAACCAAGISRVQVHARPRIAAVVTGPELLGAAADLDGGKIRDSNGPMLASLAAGEGWPLTLRLNAGDDRHALAEALQRASYAADLVVSSGGASVGDYDLLRPAVEALGGELLFHGVRMKPGKPILVARLGTTWLVGLPGNPVAALCGWSIFARPLAMELAGTRGALSASRIRCRVAAAATATGSRTTLVPARLCNDEGLLVANPCSWHGSHDLRAAAASNGFLRIEPGAELGPGELADFFPISACVGQPGGILGRPGGSVPGGVTA